MNKEIRERLKSIVSVLVFLTVVTWYWYGPRENLSSVSTNINYLSIKKEISVNVEDDIKLDDKDYNFTVKNKTLEQVNYEVIISNDYSRQRKMNCKLLTNNYLVYRLRTSNFDNESSNLGIDGIIYRGVLNSKETKDFTLNIKVDKDNVSSSECFYPIVSASTYLKI